VRLYTIPTRGGVNGSLEPGRPPAHSPEGCPRVRLRRLFGDRGYRYPTVRRLLARRRIRAVISRRSDQRPTNPLELSLPTATAVVT